MPSARMLQPHVSLGKSQTMYAALLSHAALRQNQQVDPVILLRPT